MVTAPVGLMATEAGNLLYGGHGVLSYSFYDESLSITLSAFDLSFFLSPSWRIVIAILL